MRALAQRIEVSQHGEIASMQRWLRRRGEQVPDPLQAHDSSMMRDMPGMHAVDAAGGSSAMPMPGMLTPEELAQLAATSGTDFDRLFLRDMIRHHEGALTMVAELFRTPGAGQDPELYSFAADVDADQRAEIRRMRALESALP
jgi:uncharacterized protein (DUF305 family)